MTKIPVLIVEDDSIIAESIKMTLQKLDYEVTSIISWGERVADAIERDKPEIVLMDIRLRGEMDGIQTASMINEQFDLPVVFLTSYSDDITIRNAKMAYPYGYLVKPFEERELYATLEIALFKHETSKELEKYRNHLEALVRERTQELNDINAQLEERIEEEVNKRNKQQQVIIQQSKLASLGELAAGIAHEINQPLNIISFTMDNVLAHLSSGKLQAEYLKKKMEKVFKNIFRIKNTIQHIQTFSREQKEGNCEVFQINNPVQEAVNMIYEQYRNHGIEIMVEMQEESMPVFGNPFKLEQVLLNLTSNARDALPEGGIIKIRTRRNGNSAQIEVIDNGQGIKTEILDQVIQPFFTTKQPGEGTGLGLSISYGIIRDMEGNLEIKTNSGSGVTALVTLPLQEEVV